MPKGKRYFLLSLSLSLSASISGDGAILLLDLADFAMMNILNFFLDVRLLNINLLRK